MFILSALLLWAVTAILIAWWLTRAGAELLTEEAPAVPDPVVKTVDKWMHDWERGRA